MDNLQELGLILSQDFFQWRDRLGTTTLLNASQWQTDGQLLQMLEMDLQQLHELEAPWYDLYDHLTEAFLPPVSLAENTAEPWASRSFDSPRQPTQAAPTPSHSQYSVVQSEGPGLTESAPQSTRSQPAAKPMVRRTSHLPPQSLEPQIRSENTTQASSPIANRTELQPTSKTKARSSQTLSPQGNIRNDSYRLNVSQVDRVSPEIITTTKPKLQSARKPIAQRIDSRLGGNELKDNRLENNRNNALVSSPIADLTSFVAEPIVTSRSPKSLSDFASLIDTLADDVTNDANTIISTVSKPHQIDQQPNQKDIEREAESSTVSRADRISPEIITMTKPEFQSARKPIAQRIDNLLEGNELKDNRLESNRNDALVASSILDLTSFVAEPIVTLRSPQTFQDLAMLVDSLPTNFGNPEHEVSPMSEMTQRLLGSVPQEDIQIQNSDTQAFSNIIAPSIAPVLSELPSVMQTSRSLNRSSPSFNDIPRQIDSAPIENWIEDQPLINQSLKQPRDNLEIPIDEILAAMRQEINQEYRRFYGNS